jgi:YhcH/YjgK/YiaL family protein
MAAPGVHEIIGRNLFVVVQEYQTTPGAELKLENHRRYIDIQVLYSGREEMLWAPLSKVEPLVPYNEKTDFEFFSGEGTAFDFHPGQFVIYYPSDAHRPNAQVAGIPEAVKKAVFKVKL